MSDPAKMKGSARGRVFAADLTWTGDSFEAIRFIVRVMCLDTHDELTEAWHTLIEMDFPPRATQLFHDVHLVNYPAAIGRIREILKQKGDPLLEVHLAAPPAAARTAPHRCSTTASIALLTDAAPVRTTWRIGSPSQSEAITAGNAKTAHSA